MQIRLTMILCAIITKVVTKVCDENKYFSVNFSNNRNDLYEEGINYFVDNSTENEQGCICWKDVCYKKCCDFGFVFINSTRSCFAAPAYLIPPAWINRNHSSDKSRQKNGQNELKIDQILLKPVSDLAQMSTNIEFMSFSPNASILPIAVEAENYCVEKIFEHENDTGSQLYAFMWEDIAENGIKECNIVSPLVQIVCLFISCFFILASVVMQAFRLKNSNLRIMILMAYLLTTFAYFLDMTITYFVYYDSWSAIRNQKRAVEPFVHYFFSLASLLWLNVMCYDTWFIISGRRSSSKPRKKMCWYCVFVFGVATLMTIMLIILNYIGHVPVVPYYWCSMSGSNYIFIYTTICIALVSNLVFIILIVKIGKSAVEPKPGESDQHRKLRKKFLLYVKLFVITGFAWIGKIICNLSFLQKPNNYMTGIYCYNYLLGLVIFIALIANKKTLRFIKRRFKKIKGRAAAAEAKVEIRTILQNYVKSQVNSINSDSGQENMSFDDKQTPVPNTEC